MESRTEEMRTIPFEVAQQIIYYVCRDCVANPDWQGGLSSLVLPLWETIRYTQAGCPIIKYLPKLRKCKQLKILADYVE